MTSENRGTLQMGPNTLAIPLRLFRENRERVAKAVRRDGKLTTYDQVFILLQGGESVPLYNTDVLYNEFRQEPFFTYLFGVKEPDCYGTVNVSTGRSTLFVPHLDEEYATWMGRLTTLEQYKKMYEVDEVLFTDDINKFFEEQKPSTILRLNGKNSDSGLTLEPAKFKGIDNFNVDDKILFPIISECRVIKSPLEQEVLRYVAKVSSDAHKEVMKTMKPGLTEYQGEATFLHHSYYVGGCRHMSYTCICGSGTNSAILHYGHAGAPNDRQIKNGDMCLFDMGANYFGYAADITCSFPANGKFTEDQKFIYNAVLKGNRAVLAAMKDGVQWLDMHKLANRTMLEELKAGGLLVGDVNEMMANGLNGIFQPHGLGHLIGLDVHDVGGYLDHCPPRPTEPGCTALRFNRILKAGMYVTVEPGCYFIEHLLEKAESNPNLSKFIVKGVLDRFRNFGGIRIEDNILVTETGCEDFTKVPRTVEDIEALMSGTAV